MDYMKKKGFTLVELLAVIAILAILVIIALPNVMGMFNTAKKNSFMTEVKQIYRVAQSSWVTDTIFTTNDLEYGRCDGCSYKELDLTGRRELKYYIKLNKSGCVTNYIADDGTYRFEYSGECLLITDITDGLVDVSTGEDVSNEDYLYAHYGSTTLVVGQTIPSSTTTYSSAQDLVTSANRKAFVRAKMNGNIVESIDTGIYYKGDFVYFKFFPTATYTYNKSVMDSIFPSSYCSETSEKYTCSDDENHAEVQAFKDNSKVYVMSSYSYCNLYNNRIYCDYD